MGKSIKIFSLIIFLTAMSLTSFSQKCRYDYQKTDPISGAMTRGKTFIVNLWWQLGFNQNGDNYFVNMVAVLDGNVRVIGLQGDSITFKLADNKLVSIYAKEEYVPTAQATQTGVISRYIATYNVSKETMEELASSPIVFMRMHIGTLTYDKKCSENEGERFQRMINCMLMP